MHPSRERCFVNYGHPIPRGGVIVSVIFGFITDFSGSPAKTQGVPVRLWA